VVVHLAIAQDHKKVHEVHFGIRMKSISPTIQLRFIKFNPTQLPTSQSESIFPRIPNQSSQESIIQLNRFSPILNPSLSPADSIPIVNSTQSIFPFPLSPADSSSDFLVDDYFPRNDAVGTFNCYPQSITTL
jgi:hypothetical protein